MLRLVLLFAPLLAAHLVAGQAFTALSYNIRYDNPEDGENAWLLRREFLAAQIQFHQPDILGIQEGLHRQVEYLQKALPTYQYVGVGRDDGAQAGEYTALFFQTARFEALKNGTFWLSPTPDRVSKGWDAALPRICTWAWLRDRRSQDTLLVLNTHFDHLGAQARLESARLLLRFIQSNNPGNWPVILLGDFNCTPNEAPYAVLTEELSDARTGSLQPHFGPRGTFNGFDFHKPVELQIDFIFTSKNLRSRQHATLSDHQDCRYPSDHLPVLAKLEIADQ